MATLRRRKRQGGQEIVEFALFAWFFVPVFLWMFVAGMNLTRSNQVNYICRDLASLYIHGADFSTYFYQSVAQRLAIGLNLDIGSSFTGNNAANTGNSNGFGLVTVTQIMYVGATTDANCTAVGATNCVNHDSFVYLQRIQFGNGSLASNAPSVAGTPTTGIQMTSEGQVMNYLTDSNAKLPGQAQTDMMNQWQTSANGRTALTDGQVAYITETYFKTTDFTFGTQAKGVYAKYYF
jgi:hypothetical protein